jgi:hypothetical protein
MGVTRYNGTAGGDDNAVGIALGTGNRVFVTGTARMSGSGNDIVTVRYNANNGNQMWTKAINGTANASDAAYNLIADGNDVLICGAVENTTTLQDYVLAKLNGNNGNTVFQNSYNGYGSADIATSLAKDTQGDYVVTGTVRNTSSMEYHTIKYNSSGTQQWVNKRPINQAFTQVSPKVATDFVDHIYVCGEIMNSTIDILLYQVTPGGNTTWTETHNGTQNGNDVAVDLVMGNLGVIYLAGQTQNSNAKFDYTTIKYSQTPVVFPPDFNGEDGDAAFTFFKNDGQVAYLNGLAANDVSFYTWGRQPNLFLEKGVFGFTFMKTDTIVSTDDTAYRFNMSHTDANTNTKPYAFEDKGYYGNFILPHCPQCVSNVRGYSRILIPNIYPNIDLHLYSNDEGLKYYYVVKPGGDPSAIGQLYTGTVSTQINGNGELEIDGGLENLVWDVPQAYQVNFSLQTIPVNGAAWDQVATNQYKINVPNFNANLPLIIQIDQGNQSRGTFPPIYNLGWSTYYGGPVEERNYQVETDATGNIYTTGFTSSPILPGNTFYSSLGPGQDVSLTKYLPNGVIDFYTIFGGSSSDYGNDIDVNDATGEIYVCGSTSSSNLPVNILTSSAHQGTYGGGLNDAFLLKLLSDGSNQIYSTFVGGADEDVFNGIEVDQTNGNVYLIGESKSSFGSHIITGGPVYTDVAGTGMISRFLNTGVRDATSLIGGTCRYYDLTFGPAFVVNSRSLYLVGTSLKDYMDGAPVITGTIGTPDIGNSNGIILPLSIDNATQNVTYGTGNYTGYYFGGVREDEIFDITSDGSYFYVSGATRSTTSSNNLTNGFPIIAPAGTYNTNTTLNSATLFNGFIARFWHGNIAAGPQWCSYIGEYDGSVPFSENYVHDVKFGPNGNIYLTGNLGTTNFDVVDPGSVYFNGIGSSMGYGFITVFTPQNTMLWSTYFGGQGGTAGYSLAFNNDDMFLVGYSLSPSDGVTYTFPFADDGIAYFNPVLDGGSDAFISRFEGLDFLSVEEELTETAGIFSIYPNPASNSITISSELNDVNLSYTAYNTLGQMVISEKFSKMITLDVADWESGMYFITLSDGIDQWSQKFIKK